MLFSLLACFPSLPTFVPVDSDVVVDTGPFDEDEDGSWAHLDCDDNDATVYPGAEELWDLKDNDCDGVGDEVELGDISRARIEGEWRSFLGTERGLAILPDVTANGQLQLAAGTPLAGTPTQFYLLEGTDAVRGGLIGSTATACVYWDDEWTSGHGRLARDLAAADFDGDGAADVVAVAHSNTLGAVGLFPGGLDEEDEPRLEDKVGASVAMRSYFGEQGEGPINLDIPGLRTTDIGRFLGEPSTSPPEVLVGYIHTELVQTANTTDGAVVVFDGDALAATENQVTADVKLFGDLGDHFGADIAVADFDGDGHDDLVAGAPSRGDDEGAVYLVPGPAEAWAQLAADSPRAARVLGEVGERLGDHGTLAEPADLDGDGLPELIIGSPVMDRVYVLFSGGEPGTLPVTGNAPASESSIVLSGSGAFGTAVVGSDLDADGTVELVVGAPKLDTISGEEAGVVYVFDMPQAGALTTTDALAVISGDQATAWLGSSLAAGDLDADGLPELVTGAPGWDLAGTPEEYEGALFLMTVELE